MVHLLISFPASLRVANAVACGFFQEVFLTPCAGSTYPKPGRFLNKWSGQFEAGPAHSICCGELFLATSGPTHPAQDSKKLLR
jgi:hypothetical protein